MRSEQPFLPCNELELAMTAAEAGRLAIPDFQAILLRSPIYLSSATAIQSDFSGFTPVVFNRLGVEIMACFSAAERAAHVKHRAPYLLQQNAGEFIARILPDLGLVINPGHAVCLELMPPAVKRLGEAARRVARADGPLAAP
jgi:hypothetical protein